MTQDGDFSTLFDLLPIGAYRSSPDGRQLRANAALVRFNGYDSEAQMLAAVHDIGREWYVDPGARPRFQALMARDGRVHNFRSEVFRHRTRERRWIVEHAHLVRDAQGQALFYEGTVEDVTDTHEAHLALQASERRFRALTERAQVLTLVCDAETRILYASPASQAILGRSPASMRGTTVLHWIHPDDLASALHDRELLLAGRTSGTESLHRLRHADGSWRWLASLATDCRDDEAVGGFVLNFRDATERKRAEAAEQALRALNAELEQRTRQLQTTLQSISQGICMITPEGRIGIHNARACELLDLPESLLATHPLLDDIARHQQARGDFARGVTPLTPGGPGAMPVCDPRDMPDHYLRTTADGRTLEIRSQPLPGGGLVRTFADVTAFVQAERSRERLHLLLEATQALARVGGWEVDLRTRQVFWTDEVYRLLDTSPQAYTPTIETTMRFFTPESQQRVARAIEEAERHGIAHDLELEMVTATGRRIWVHSVSRVTLDDGRVVKRTSVLQDITERVLQQLALQESEARWKLALEATGDGMWDWQVQTGVEVCSRRCKEMYGYAEHEIPDLASAFDALTHPADIEQVHRDRQAHFEGRTPAYVNEHRVRCKDGSWKWVLSRGTVISRDADGRPLRMIGTHTDITTRKQAESLIWHQANYDALTGLPNRRMLRDRLEQEIRRCDRERQQLALLFIDLDHFKEVNDTLGHDAGDALLVEAARRIRACVRDTDTVARMGGDEFTIVLCDLHDDQWVSRVTESLLGELSARFEIGSEQVYVSASIGITLYPDDAREVEDLFKHADQALYVAKGAGRNRFSFFTRALQEAAQARVRLSADLRVALAESQFDVYFQPIVRLSDGAVHKAEALVRWRHPSRGWVPPAEFIPVAESTGLIADIGDWVFHRVADQLAHWRRTLNPGFQISLNRSPAQFHDDDGRQQRWLERMQALGLEGSSLVVEITEGLLLDTGAEVTEQLLALRDAGVQVSLDDFGTGYSSLTYLQRLDIDFIKIDRSFVRDLIPECTELALCKAIIVMAHELGMAVVAEGVETEGQRALLAAAGCDYAQGYLFSRAVPAPEFEGWLRARAPQG